MNETKIVKMSDGIVNGPYNGTLSGCILTLDDTLDGNNRDGAPAKTIEFDTGVRGMMRVECYISDDRVTVPDVAWECWRVVPDGVTLSDSVIPRW